MDERRAIVVVGMHRSGTSLCMNILHALKFVVDNDLTPGNKYNERGYFESREIIRLNEEILRCIGASWYAPPPSLSSNWMKLPHLKSFKKRIALLLDKKPLESPQGWAFKDPRVSLLLPLYNAVFNECGITPAYIICVRDPRSVAQSLVRRDAFPPLVSEMLWLDYNSRIIEGTAGRLRVIVDYDSWFTNGIKQARTMLDGLCPETNYDDDEIRQLLKAVVEPLLNHGTGAHRNFVLACTEPIYKSLKKGDMLSASADLSEAAEGLKHFHR